MKRTLDIVAAVLLLVGGINWGLIGTMNLDLVAKLFGDAPTMTTLVYSLVGVAALYHLFVLKTLQKTWSTCSE